MSNANSTRPPNVVIVGCGAIGGVLGAHLLQEGHDFSICTTNPLVRKIWETSGPYLSKRPVAGPLDSNKVLESLPQKANSFDLAFVAVPPPQITRVARDLSHILSDNGRVICLSNGWCEPHLAEVVGEERVLGAVVTWGARMPEPGCYIKTSKGGFVVGQLAGPWNESSDLACEWLKTVGEVRRTDNLKGARMSKLVINCAVSGLGTVGGAELGELLGQRFVRDVGIHLMEEAVQVARAAGVELERLVGIDWRYFESGPPRLTTRMVQHGLLIAMGFRYRKLRSSILSSIERGRPPAIDHINGEISSIGRRVGIPTPYNDAVVETVWRIARGEAHAGPRALREVQERADNSSTPTQTSASR